MATHYVCSEHGKIGELDGDGWLECSMLHADAHRVTSVPLKRFVARFERAGNDPRKRANAYFAMAAHYRRQRNPRRGLAMLYETMAEGALYQARINDMDDELHGEAD